MPARPGEGIAGIGFEKRFGAAWPQPRNEKSGADQLAQVNRFRE